MWVRGCMRRIHTCVQIQKSEEEACIVLGHSPFHPFETGFITEPGGSQQAPLTLLSPSLSTGFTEMWVATSEILDGAEIGTQTLVCAQKTTLTYWDIYPAFIFSWFFYSHFTDQTTIWIWYSFFLHVRKHVGNKSIIFSFSLSFLYRTQTQGVTNPGCHTC